MSKHIFTLQNIVFIFFLIACKISFAQAGASEEKGLDKLSPKEFSIPTSPLFDLMGAAPSLVARTIDIKDFKVDWSFKNWRLNPNLAIEAQPVWELFYNRKKIEKYQRANYLQRTLASLDLSAGTIQGETGSRRIGGAVKMNLYRQKDPLLIKNIYDTTEKVFDEELVQLKAKEKDLLKHLDTLFKPAELQQARLELKENDALLASFYGRRNNAIKERASSFISENWNAAFIDIAYGKIFTYNTDSAEALGKLQLNRNTGNGAWVNFGTGIGKRGLISGLIRTTFYEEEITFSLQDETTGEQTIESAIAGNKLFSFGVNFRYGGPVFNFFAEMIYEGKKSTTPLAALQSTFAVPDGKQVIQSTVKWNVVQPYTFNFGGDWRISRNVILNYGIRCLMDKNLKVNTVIPIANISCLMR